MSTASEAPAQGVTPTDAMAPEPSGRRRFDFFRTMRAPLRYRDFRLLFAGQIVSVIGDQFYAVALPWLVLSNGGTAQDLGFILTAYGVPRVVTVLLGGWLADRWRPRVVMLLSDAMRTLMVAGLAALAIFAHPDFTQIAALAIGLGVFDGFFIPASWTIIPDVLPDDALQAGNSLNFSWTQLANLLGPTIAGLVVTAFASGPALAIDAGTFLVSTLTLLAMRAPRPVRAATATAATAATTSVEGAATDGEASTRNEQSFVRFLLHSRLFQTMLLVSIVLNLVLNGMIEVGLPSLAQQTFLAGAGGYGLMLTGFGLGGLLGGLLGSTLANVRHRGAISMALIGLQCVAIVLIPYLGGVRGAAAALALMGLCNSMSNVTFMTLIQSQLPRHLLGRFMGALAFANFGLFPVSAAISGVVVNQFGAPIGIAASGALAFLVTLVALTSREVRSV